MLRTLRDHGRHSWLLGMEAFDTIASYSGDTERILRDAASHAGAQLYLGACELPYEAFFDCLPQADLSTNRLARTSSGGPSGSRTTIAGPETIVYGHWNNGVLDRDGWPTPACVGATIGIDTIAHGVLTAVRLPDRRLFQTARHPR